jgi:hypothetical protein
MSRIQGREFSDYLKYKHSQGVARRDAFGKTGLQCPACRYVHPYVGSEDKKLGVTFEKRDEAWVVMWKCPLTDDAIGEIWLGDKRARDTGTNEEHRPSQTSP